MKNLIAVAAIGLLAACAPPAKAPETAAAPAAPAAIVPVTTTAPSGDYTLDKAHSTLLFRVNHLGFSHFTGRFTQFDIKLKLDAANPTASSVNATIQPASLALDNPPRGFLDQVRGGEFLDAKKFPVMTFASKSVEMTGPSTARITGDFTMHGATKPVTLDATFNGGYPGMSLDPHARVGFSAKGTLKRSDFGISYGIPAPGTTMGVSDDVEIIIETELSGPAFVAPPAAPPAAPGAAPKK